MKLLEWSKHQLLVLKHANGVVGLHGNFDRCEGGVCSGTTYVDQLSLQAVLLDPMLDRISIIVLRAMFKLIHQLQACFLPHTICLPIFFLLIKHTFCRQSSSIRLVCTKRPCFHSHLHLFQSALVTVLAITGSKGILQELELVSQASSQAYIELGDNLVIVVILHNLLS